jgi:hypothetical protein
MFEETSREELIWVPTADFWKPEANPIDTACSPFDKRRSRRGTTMLISLQVQSASWRAMTYVTGSSGSLRTRRRRKLHDAWLGYFQEREASPMEICSWLFGKRRSGREAAIHLSLLVCNANRKAMGYLIGNLRARRREDSHDAKLWYFQEREATPMDGLHWIFQIEKRRRRSEKNPHDA